MVAGPNKGESIVKLDVLHSLASRCLTALVAAGSIILTSCGGGGAASSTEGGHLVLIPAAASLYAGVPYTFQVLGGRKPYRLSSSEPTLLPVPESINTNTFQVVPNNPGVVDANSQATIPVRSVIITVRDADGNDFQTPSSAGLTVSGNFLTGYGISYASTCSAGAGASAPAACSGGDSLVRLQAVTNGALYGGRTFRFEVVRGSYQFVTPERPSNQPEVLSNTFTAVSDHDGIATARFRVPASAFTQLATIRVIDVASGVYVDEVFVIQQGAISGALTIIPSTITFTGLLSTRCGTGAADFLVFDGEPQFTATSTDGLVAVTSTSDTNPGRFTVTVVNQSVCFDEKIVVVTDRAGRRATVSVKSEAGSSTPPTLTVSPSAITVICGSSGSASVVGGVGGYSVASSHPRVTGSVSGNTVTVSRLAGDGATLYPTSATISITDGTSIASLTVTVPANCP